MFSHISKSEGCFNVKFARHYFHMKMRYWQIFKSTLVHLLNPVKISRLSRRKITQHRVDQCKNEIPCYTVVLLLIRNAKRKLCNEIISSSLSVSQVYFLCNGCVVVGSAIGEIQY